MIEEVKGFLLQTFLFKGMRKESFQDALHLINAEKKNYMKGDLILSPRNSQGIIGFVCDGECEVRTQHSTGSYTPINRIVKYGSFGIISVFSSEAEYPTYIFASKKTSIVFIKGEELIMLAKRYPTVSLNIINFLVGRISFLNDKIATFSGSTVEEKLASYILYRRKVMGEDEFPFNKAKASAVINSGRASVYRALEKLTANELIKIDEQKIIILDPKGLEGISK